MIMVFILVLMPDLTAGCCALTALLPRQAISCSRLRCAVSLAASASSRSGGRVKSLQRQQLVEWFGKYKAISRGFW